MLFEIKKLMKFFIISLFSILILANSNYISLNENSKVDLDKYIPYNDSVSWQALGCDQSFSVVCLDPPIFYGIFKKDQTKFQEIKEKLIEKFGNDSEKLIQQLQTEYDNITKEVATDGLTMDKLRENAFNQISLIKALQVNRIIELDKFIASKKAGR